jgi:sigma-E factor negative regulatory protein RseA
MNNHIPEGADDRRWLLSAMADGEADAAEVGRGCAAWAAGDDDARSSWHAYHLIGDVLRSGDLAHPPGRDRAFLQRLSARLDDEPAVLAPAPLPAAAATRRRPSWAMPAALAAGVMALATVMVVALGPSGDGASTPKLAATPAAPTTVAGAAPPGAAPAVAPELSPQGGRVVRDAQLDRYLRAHREYATAVPGSLPGGSGRSIATVSFER